MDDQTPDLNRSLAELSETPWNDPAVDDDLVRQLYGLWTKPLRKFTLADLLLAVGQNLGLAHTVPMALERLADDPFCQAGPYPGDLLTALLEADRDFWVAHLPLWMDAIALITKALEAIQQRMETEERGDYLPFHLPDDFMIALVEFRQIHGAAEE